MMKYMDLDETSLNSWRLGYEALHYAGVPGATIRRAT